MTAWTDTDLDDNEPGAWLNGPDISIPGTGTGLHVYALRVHDVGTLQSPTDDQMEQELDNLIGLVGSRIETTTIEGYDGEYVVYAIPYGD